MAGHTTVCCAGPSAMHIREAALIVTLCCSMFVCVPYLGCVCCQVYALLYRVPGVGIAKEVNMAAYMVANLAFLAGLFTFAVILGERGILSIHAVCEQAEWVACERSL